ncbi:MAG: hypothetical protein Q8L85_08530 [Alphaproteobacteria bacterium]|nr:hypothetical protein [Alphaproteobacteria bacterium]
MQRNNNMLNKIYQDYILDLDKLLLTNTILPNNNTKLFFITPILKKDVDRTILMTYN